MKASLLREVWLQKYRPVLALLNKEEPKALSLKRLNLQTRNTDLRSLWNMKMTGDKNKEMGRSGEEEKKSM
jgi:hypothetical protein